MNDYSMEESNGWRRPYRVLLVDLAKRFGGVEMRVVVQARALQKVVARCSVATLQGSPLHLRLLEAGIPCVPLAGSRVSPRLLIGLLRTIRRDRYQIVDVHNVQSVFWGHLAALLAGVPGRVTTIHTNWREEYTGVKGMFYESVLQLDYLATRHIVTVTEKLQAMLVAHQGAQRCTLIHNAVQVPERAITATERERRREWGFTPNDFVVASIARLYPVKGHQYLLEAMAQLADLPHVKLLLVGDGPLRSELEAQVQDLGLGKRLHFAGMRQDVLHILPAIDCLCMASLWESLPFAVLEAAAFARPIVATAVGGMETLLEHEHSALLVPAKDPTALAKALRDLATNPELAERLGHHAYQLVYHSFSTSLLLRKTLSVYDRVLPASAEPATKLKGDY